MDLAPLTRDEIARWLGADSAEAEAVLRKTSGWPGAIAAFCAARELGRFAREGGDDGDDERVIAELLAAGAAGAAVDGLPRDKVYALGRAGVVVEVGARLVVRDSESYANAETIEPAWVRTRRERPSKSNASAETPMTPGPRSTARPRSRLAPS